MNNLRIHERICTPCSERVRKCVRWCSQYLFNVHTCTCMALKTPVWMHATLPAKNAQVPMHARLCNSAEVSLPWKLLRTYLKFCASIVLGWHFQTLFLAQSSQLELLFSLKRGKRDVRALSFAKMTPHWVELAVLLTVSWTVFSQ